MKSFPYQQLNKPLPSNPNSRAARIIRTAISPRLAIKIFRNMENLLVPNCKAGYHCCNTIPLQPLLQPQLWCHDVLQKCCHNQLVAWYNLLLELNLVHTSVKTSFPLFSGFDNSNTPAVCQGFHNQNTWHNWVLRKVAVKERFVNGHFLIATMVSSLTSRHGPLEA